METVIEQVSLKQGEYLWMIRLHNGELHFLSGLGILEAVGKLNLDLDAVRRYMPIRYQSTEPLSEERKQEIQEIRKAALVKAREVRKANREREENDGHTG